MLDCDLLPIVSVLSDTAFALGDKREELMNSNNADAKNTLIGGNTAIMATVDHFTYSTIPQKVKRYLHQMQWMDLVASIGPVQRDGDDGIVSELVFDTPKEAVQQNESFGFKVNSLSDQECGPTKKIVWNA